MTKSHKDGIWERLREALEREERGVLVTVVAGEGAGAKLLVLESGERLGDETLAPYADAQVTGTIEEGERTVLAELIGPPLHLVIFGAVDMAESLCRIAAALGWRTTVVDPRGGLATRERIPSADELVLRWPDEAGAELRPPRRVVELVGERRHRATVQVEPAVRVAAGREQEQRAPGGAVDGVAEVDLDPGRVGEHRQRLHRLRPVHRLQPVAHAGAP